MQEILVNVDKQRNKTIVVVENGRLVEKYQENDGAERQKKADRKEEKKNVILGGICCGLALCVAMYYWECKQHL